MEEFNNVTERRCLLCGGKNYNNFSSYCFHCQTKMSESNASHVDTQEAKADADKPVLSLVPKQK